MIDRTPPPHATVDLVGLPQHPPGLPWPTDVWPTAPLPDGVEVEPLLDLAFDGDGPLAETLAVVMVHKGRLVAERYADGVDSDTTLISWSMAKSVAHALVGMLVGEGRLTLDERAPVEAWRDPSDPRSGITLEHLLTMRDGLDFVEDYVDDSVSHVIQMLFGAGQHDVAGFTVARPSKHAPGEVFNYSSGTSNVVARIAGDAVGGGREGMERFIQERLFDPLGMTSATARFDDAGTFIASSFVYATARDFARFGYLYLRDGVWAGHRLLPEGWVDHARRARSFDEEDQRWYGAHWWVTGDEHGSFWANGYEGQSILVSPGTDLVLVRLGKTPKEHYPDLAAFRAAVVDAFARAR